jgi:hypothetical protein
MPEVGLGIGRYRGLVGGLSQEILTWYDAAGDRQLSPEERERQRTEEERLAKEQERQAKEQERQAKEQAQQRAERLEELLRAQGIDPDRLLDV